MVRIGVWWGKPMGIPWRGGRAGRRRRGVPAPCERGRAPRDAGDRGGGRRRRRRDGCLPGRQAPARLPARQGHLPPRPRRDSSPRDRTPPCDQGGRRVPLPHPAGCSDPVRQPARPQMREDRARRARRRRAPPPGSDRGERARDPLRLGDRRGRAAQHLRGAPPGRHDGAGPGTHRVGFDAYLGSNGIRGRRRRLRRLHPRDGDAARAARRYYLRHFLEGNRDPLPYRTPYRTRRVPVAQDLMWERFPLQDPVFCGLGERPVEFPEIELTYDTNTARAEAAGCQSTQLDRGRVPGSNLPDWWLEPSESQPWQAPPSASMEGGFESMDELPAVIDREAVRAQWLRRPIQPRSRAS